MTHPATLCLNMIVKNEMANIERCLRAVADHISCWVIADTGSTDGTQDFIREFFVARGIAGELHSFDFKTFEQARNDALDRARGSTLAYDYLLLTDADMELTVDDPDFRRDLTADAYQLVQRSGVTYWNTRLLRRTANARYVGVTHEYVDLKGGETRELSGAAFIDHASGGNRPGKFSRDVALLRGALDTERDPGLRARYTFYLANSLRDDGDLAGALDVYLERARLGLWHEEVFVSLFNAGEMKAKLGHPVEEVIATFEAATTACPTRAEALHAAARFCRDKSLNERGYRLAARGLAIPLPPAGLFIYEWVYRFGLLDELAVNAFWAGRYRECEAACDRLLAVPDISIDDRERVSKNRQFARDKLASKGMAEQGSLPPTPGTGDPGSPQGSEKVRIAAWHPQWSEFLVLSPADGSIGFEGFAPTGRYTTAGNLIHIAWHQFPPETFERKGDVYVFRTEPTRSFRAPRSMKGSGTLKVVLVRSFYSFNEATYRIQSDPLLRGLAQLEVSAAVVTSEADIGEQFWDTPPSHLIFHFFDVGAAALAKQIKRRTGAKVLCLGADIYDLDLYLRLDDVVDTFLMPTRLHVAVLAAASRAEVVHLPEGVDPIALPQDGVEIPVVNGSQICWFGYPESFSKSLRHVMRDLIENELIDLGALTLITKTDSKIIAGIKEIAFDAGSFYKHTSVFSISLLSHFAYDLHLNSYIKSPNKMITSIVRGMIPVISDTPSYRALADRYGLSSLSFSSGESLGRILRQIDYEKDAQRLALKEIRTDLLRTLSPARVAASLLSLTV